MADISARKRGNKWEYRFEGGKVDGKRKQITKGGFRTKKEALDAAAAALSEYNAAGEIFTPSEISLRDFVGIWLERHCKTQVKSITYFSYKDLLEKHYLEHFGDYKLRSISHDAIQNIINDLFNRGYSRNAIKKILIVFKNLMKYAVQFKYIKYDPCTWVKLPSVRAVPKIPTNSRPNVYIPPDIITAIFERFPEGNIMHLPMQLLYRCGLRKSEVRGLCWDDIDFESSQLSIKGQLQYDRENKKWLYSKPKYNSVRTLGLDNELVDLLKREKLKQENNRETYGGFYTHIYIDDGGYINTNGTGKPLSLVVIRENGSFLSDSIFGRTSKIIKNELGYKEFTMHSFRHTHATILAEANLPIKYIQDRLGHKNPEVTMRIYQHLTDNTREKSDQMLNGIFDQRV